MNLIFLIICQVVLVLSGSTNSNVEIWNSLHIFWHFEEWMISQSKKKNINERIIKDNCSSYLVYIMTFLTLVAS